MKIVLTGASGFIGKRLLTRLSIKGIEAIALARHPESLHTYPCRTLRWDAGADASAEVLEALKDAHAVVHLAGESVASGRWSEETKKRILDSRVLGTKNLVDAIASLPAGSRPKALLSGSATGFYGDSGDPLLDEESPSGEGFLAEVVKAWEAEAIRAEALGVRVVRLRTGIVLGHECGALQKMQPVILGSGKQWMSWIHVEDVIRLIEFAIERSDLHGAINLTAPAPVQNAEFTRSFARMTGALVTLKAPALVLKAAMGEMSQIVLYGARIFPKRAIDAGFTFLFPSLESALAEIFPAPFERRFSAVQFVPKPLLEVFDFFGRAENLEAITPPWLSFRIMKKSTNEITSGTLIDYQLKIHGLPVRWQSRIEEWSPPTHFVDVQVKGPYAKWHHTHRFEAVRDGTLVIDEIVYSLPAGPLGGLFGGGLVRTDIERIFSHRRSIIAEALDD